ncbi:peptidase [Mycena latifolia]|nr:peptidase [Mycena latifolia]
MRFSIFPFAIALAASVIAHSESGQLPLSVDGRKNAQDFDLDALRLVQFSLEDTESRWMTERQKLEVKAQGIDFMDITDTPFLGWSKKKRFSYPVPNSTIVGAVFSGLSTAETRANLEHFTSYHNRYYNSDTGKASSEWLHAKILAYTAGLASEEQKKLIVVKPITHPFKQISVSDPIAILGCHIDSLNHEDASLRAPGADDDGSGTVTILEAYRALLLANYIPVSPLEFHFYAGEEGGLRGSQALASAYENAGKEVKGMVHFDMTAWHAAGTREEIAVITNNVDTTLTDFLILLIERYLDIPWVKDKYPPNANSDHSSWTKAGYQTAHPLEGQWNYTNDHVHSVEDRIDISPEFSFDHMLHFSKLAVAFAIELSSY